MDCNKMHSKSPHLTLLDLRFLQRCFDANFSRVDNFMVTATACCHGLEDNDMLRYIIDGAIAKA